MHTSGGVELRGGKIRGVDSEVTNVASCQVVGLFDDHRVQAQPRLGGVHSKALKKSAVGKNDRQKKKKTNTYIWRERGAWRQGRGGVTLDDAVWLAAIVRVVRAGAVSGVMRRSTSSPSRTTRAASALSPMSGKILIHVPTERHGMLYSPAIQLRSRPD